MEQPTMITKELVEAALKLLGKRRLVLSIHDGSFPGDAEEEIGRGTPYGSGGRAFVEFVRDLGFNGLQLGPQGQTGRRNPSPYDSTAWSRNVLSIAPGPLARDPQWAGLLPEETLARALRDASPKNTENDGGVGRDARPGGGGPVVEEAGGAAAEADRERVRYELAFASQRRLLQRVSECFEERRSSDPAVKALAKKLEEFSREHRGWLEPDALYEALAGHYGTEDWTRWLGRKESVLDRRLFCPQDGGQSAFEQRRRELEGLYARRIGFYELCQFLAHQQHLHFHRNVHRLGLYLYADLPIGLSPRDAWVLQPLFLDGYRLGAPPSRTNPEGQPWNFHVFDPESYDRPGRAAFSVKEYLSLRMNKIFGEYDGLRIDHPQGLVCPWVYRSDDPDPLHAVQQGARLFASPDLADHPRLAAYAIVRPEQLAGEPGVKRYDDNWVRSLEPQQVERYAALMEIIMDCARRHGRDIRDVACEVLSTLPYPLARVMDRYDLGRFRVTQKANLEDPADSYRSENAQPKDWVMLGNHDTPPIWSVVKKWRKSEEVRDRAAYLSRRLARSDSSPTPAELQSRLSSDAGRLVQAQLADALLSPAEQVLVFFTDLFGLEEAYNVPGTVGPHNWSLRVPHDYRRMYPERSRRLRALNLPFALALALRSRSRCPAGLIEKLEAAARRTP